MKSCFVADFSPGHCYLMMDDLQQAYSAYQQALYHLSDPKVGFCACLPVPAHSADMPYRNQNFGMVSAYYMIVTAR